MTNYIYIIVSLILVLIVLIIIYILFNTYKKTYENYSNANSSSLSPTSYNSTNCKPLSDEVQFPKAYNDFCNTQHTLEDVSLSQPKQNKRIQPLLSLHTLPKLHSSKKLYAYNEYCDISQGSLTNNIPYAYNEYCMTQLRLRNPLDTNNNTYVSPLAILSNSQTLSPILLPEQQDYHGRFNSSFLETSAPIILPVVPVAPATPVVPVAPATPVVPVVPVAPVVPATPIVPVTPVTPIVPVTPVTPIVPVTPVTPIVPPVAPATPIVPPVAPATPIVPPVAPATPIVPPVVPVATSAVTTLPSRPQFSTGYGDINGWYSPTISTHLLDNPITIYYEQMLRNYSPDTWKSLLRFPIIIRLPNYGLWWNWTSELENINKVIDYLGIRLGKYETHFVAATEIAEPLIWVEKQIRNEDIDEDPFYKIINTALENMLLNKINTALPNANIVLTPQEWSSCNITTNIITLHYINVGSSQYTPFSPGTDNVNSETLAIINRDWEIGAEGELNPNLTLRIEECNGICLSYKTKANKKRMYMACDIGMGHYRAMNQEWFINLSNNAKTQWLRKEIYAYISHEYSHVYQMQLIDSVVPERWHRYRTQLGERTSNSLTGWWVECFATILPFFMGFSSSGFNMLNEIENAINNIKTSNSLTASEFSTRMMYRHPYGYFPGSEYYMWAYLVATYMAQLKTWKYVLVDFYYDFQRIPSSIPINISRRTMLAPDLDKLFLHNFEKTEEQFLQDIYTKVKNETITLVSLRNWLPNGPDFNISTLIKFNWSNLINPIQFDSTQFNVI